MSSKNVYESQGTRRQNAYKADVALELSKLPEDLATVKQIAVNLSVQNDLLIEEVRLLTAQLYGRRSEKLQYKNDPQLLLFDGPPAPAEKDDDESEETEVGSHKRRKPVRKPLPAHLPRIDNVIDIPEADKVCACGANKRCFSSEESEQLDIIPQLLRVIRNIRKKYYCPKCEGTAEPEKPTFAIAPPPLQLIAKSIATPGLLAHIVTAKFVDAMPLYRQQTQFARMGVDLTRGTMCSWVIKLGDACAKLVEFLFEAARAGKFVNLDESRLQVLKEEGRDASDGSYAWVLAGGTPEKPVIAFMYSPSRGSKVAQSILNGYEGHVVTDAYAGYDFLEKLHGVTHHACWAHARRGFTDAIKAAGETLGQSSSIAQQAVRWIRKLYQVERRADENNVSDDERAAIRQRESKPILDAFKVWLDSIRPKIPPKSRLGKAIGYTLNAWVELVAYADTGFVSIDNNRVENCIRPFVVGRKNWLFADTPAGAVASMRLYSLVETAKANGIDPYWYLRFLFERLPAATTDEQLRALLPTNVDKSSMQRYTPPSPKRRRSRRPDAPTAVL